MCNAASKPATSVWGLDNRLTRQSPIARRQSLRWALFLILSGLFLAGCQRTPPVVKIGLVGPFEGRHRAIGYDTIYSARLAVREINQNGGIGPYRVALVALDDNGDLELAAQAAASLVVDPAVVAVIGHWLPETTAAARPVYAQAEMPFLAAGELPLSASDPLQLPAGFRAAYAEVTPFDEEAGPYAGPAYDAVNLLLLAMQTAVARNGAIDRATVTAALSGLRYEGVTGTVYQK